MKIPIIKIISSFLPFMLLPIQSELRSIANPLQASGSSRFFKNGSGQYGEGDVFLGISVPETRKIVKKYLTTSSIETVGMLLVSEYHEERLAAMLILVDFAKRKTFPVRELADFYMKHADRINNWDLVDVSSEHIIGPYLAELPENKRMEFIEACITSTHLWTNRIILLASFYSIKKGDPSIIFRIAPRFFTHKHDLIHKAAGWMLREAGKRCDERLLWQFLDEYAGHMPRTMLRYSIERLSEEQRKGFMQKERIYAM